jgi:hypothetical protein
MIMILVSLTNSLFVIKLLPPANIEFKLIVICLGIGIKSYSFL